MPEMALILDRRTPQRGDQLSSGVSGRKELDYLVDEAPPPGTVIEIANGILWTRIPLPFRLNHVNVYFIADGDGWAIVDTGIGTPETKAAWEALLAGPLKGFHFTRLIVTHMHPDHIGLAGWLCEALGLPLWTSYSTYVGSTNFALASAALESTQYRAFYKRHGMSDETATIVSTQGHDYLRMVVTLPETYKRIVEGDRLPFGERTLDVLTGNGHAPEQIMLYSREEKLLLSADQVLSRITPNISVWAVEPDGDPLGLYLRSLRRLRTELADDAIVLPGHQLPFRGLAERCTQIIEHHEIRCDRILEACRTAPRSVAELIPVLFSQSFNAHQTSFAFSEAHAHANYLRLRGQLAWQPHGDLVKAVIPGD